MNNKKLLEKAAEIHGIKGQWWELSKWQNLQGRKWKVGDGPRILAGHELVYGTHNTKPWNPLKNGKDAFELAVQHDVFTTHIQTFHKHMAAASKVSSISKEEALCRAIVQTVVEQASIDVSTIEKAPY